MIDEADEFVTGPQNKGKRPGSDTNMHGIGGGGPKRRRCMSPLLRPGRAYSPPVSPAASPFRPPLTGETLTHTSSVPLFSVHLCVKTHIFEVLSLSKKVTVF